MCRESRSRLTHGSKLNRMTRSTAVSGARRGLLIAALVTFGLIVIAALLLGFDKVMQPDHGTGLSLINGFLILPLTIVAGLPWSLLALKYGDSPTVGVPILVAGVLLNGAIIGAVVGTLRKAMRGAPN